MLKILGSILKTRWLLYFVVLIILGLVVIGFIELSGGARQINWNDVLGNLSAEILGIFITIFILDFILVYNEERRNQKIAKIPLAQIRGQFNRLLGLICDQYEAVSGVKLSSTDVEALLTEEVAESICGNLNPSENPPVRYEHPTTWEQHNKIFAEKFKTDVDLIIDKYLLYLPEDLILILEKLKTASVFLLFEASRSYRGLLKEKGLEDKYLQGHHSFYNELFVVCRALDKHLRVRME